MAKTETPKTNPEYELKAVVDIGSTSIRMVVAQIQADGSFQTLDSLSQSVAIGSDTFTKGRISRSTIEECVKVLRSFSAVLKEYQIDLRSGVRAVATSAVREARNRDVLLDRIYMATDIDVEVIEGTEVNRLTFLGIRSLLASNASLRRGRLLVLEVGGGSTEFLELNDGRVEVAHTYRLGAVRLRERMDALPGSAARRLELLESEVDVQVRQCREAVETVAGKHQLLIMGGEARVAARLLNREWEESRPVSLKVGELSRLAARVLEMDVGQVARKYHLSIEDAQTFGTALLCYVRLARVFNLKRLHVCGITLRDGLLAEAASGNAWTEDFVEQIINSVQEVGHHYQLDTAHADGVARNALTLFRSLEKEHRLDYRSEVILRVAALLHDIGMFIGNSSHHKHSRYIIENSDLFGLGREELKLTALVARYHRRALPRSSHADYAALPREQRLMVNQLAAILRVADALDRSHTQLLSDLRVRIQPGRVILESNAPGDFTAEKQALAEKGGMFEQVYGRTIVLRTKKKQA